MEELRWTLLVHVNKVVSGKKLDLNLPGVYFRRQMSFYAQHCQPGLFPDRHLDMSISYTKY